MIRLIMEVPALENGGRQPAIGDIGVGVLPSGRVKALDELLYLPHLNILLCDVWLTHDGQW